MPRAVFLCVFAALVGCQSSPSPANAPAHADPATSSDPTGQPVQASGQPVWVDNPGTVKEHLAAVGSSPLLGNVSQARNSAAADGRAQMAAILKAEINQMIENWAKAAGDLKVKESLTSLVNQEEFTRQFVDQEISGAQPSAYYKDAETQYCLVVLRDPSAWQRNIDQALEEQCLRDETLWKTEVLKSDARARMDGLKADNEAKRAAQKKTVDGWRSPVTP